MKVCNILVASSNAATRGEVRAALEFEGHDVTEAWTAHDTIRLACSGPLDLLVVDSTVDGVPAAEICHAIRAQSKLGIIVWGGESGMEAIDVLNAGADDYIPAPMFWRNYWRDRAPSCGE